MEYPKHQAFGYILIAVAICVCCFAIVYKMEESRTEIIDTTSTQETDSEIISNSDTNHSGYTDIVEKDGKQYVIRYQEENGEITAQLIPVNETSADTASTN